jgi:hypothetical protein
MREPALVTMVSLTRTLPARIMPRALLLLVARPRWTSKVSNRLGFPFGLLSMPED